MTGTVKRIIATAALTIAAATTAAGCGTAHHETVIRYTTQQPTCAASQLGEHARFVGDGPRSFQAICDRDGSVNVWDAR